MRKNKFYELTKSGKQADITIFGDITSMKWFDSDVSAHDLRSDVEALEDVEQINVHINSYGGEVAEGLAIYNTLKNHTAKVVTYCDGFACSIASVIFMAGDERIMNEASVLMIHNAWTCASGDANAFRKVAADMDVITNQSKKVYLANINIEEDELTEIMDKETWLEPSDALEMGFCTKIDKDDDDAASPSQSARKMVFEKVTAKQDENAIKKAIDILKSALSEDEEDSTEDDEQGNEEPETDSTEEPENGEGTEEDEGNKEDEPEQDAWQKYFKK